MISLISQQTNPFPGLRPFELDEEHLFFGREGQSEELLDRLNQTRFLGVVGASGSGKSSLIRAGLLPLLYSGFLSGRGSRWRVAILRPGEAPLHRLAEALNKPDVLGKDSSEEGSDRDLYTVFISSTLRRGALGLVTAAKQARMRKGENLLVVVDQFEELFRFKQASMSTAADDEAAAFVKLLLAAAAQRDVPIFVALTMRSDFLGDCSQFRDLPEALNDGQYLVPRLTRDQLRCAIEGPVAVGGGTITPQLVNRLLNEVGTEPDQLPILQHALMRSWNEGTERSSGEPTLDISHYEKIGGIKQALSRHADQVYIDLPDERSRMIAEIIFKCLTEKGLDNREVRRPMKVGTIRKIAGASLLEIVTVIKAFSELRCSFLATPVDADKLTDNSIIDISHESLMRNWEQLKTWVKEEAESASVYRRLAETAALYEQGRADYSRDPELTNQLDWKERQQPNADWAERYASNFEEAIFFLKESERHAIENQEQAEEAQKIKEEARRKRVRILTVLAASTSALFIASVFFGVWAFKLAKESEIEKTRATAQRLTVQSKQLQTDQPNLRSTATLLAIEAVGRLQGINDTSISEAKTNLLRSILQLPKKMQSFDDISSYAFSPDSQYLAVGTSGGHVKLVELSSQETVLELKHDNNVTLSLSFSENGKYLTTTGIDRVNLIDLSAMKVTASYESLGVITTALFSPDERYFTLSQEDGNVKVMESKTGTVIISAAHDGVPPFVGQTFSPDSNYLETVSKDGTIRLLDLENKTVSIVSDEDSTTYSEFTADSKYLIAYQSEEGEGVNLISTETKDISHTIESADAVSRVSVSDENQHIIVSNWTGQFRTVNPDKGKVVSTFDYGKEGYSFKVDKDSKYLAIAPYEEDVIDIVDLSTNKIVGKVEHENRPDLFFTDDSKYLISKTDTKLNIYNLENNVLVRSFDQSSIDGMVISESSEYIASHNSNGIVTLLKIETGEVISSIRHSDISGLTFSENSQYLAVGGNDQTTKIVESETGLVLSNVEKTGTSGHLTFSKNEQYFIASDYSNFTVYKTDKLEDNQSRFKHTNNSIGNGSFDKEKKILFLFSERTIDVIDTNARNITYPIYNANKFRKFVVSDDSKYLLVSDFDDAVKVFDIENENEIADIEHESELAEIGISLNSKYAFTVNESSETIDSSLKIIELSTGQVLNKLLLDKSRWSLGFTEDGKYLFAWKGEGEVKVIEAKSGKVLYSLKENDEEKWHGWQVSTSKDSSYFSLLSTEDKKVTLYETQSKKKIREIEYKTPIQQAFFSEDGKFLAIRSAEKLDLINVLENELVVDGKSSKAVSNTSFSEDGKVLASYSDNGNVSIISTETGKDIASLAHDLPARFLKFSSDSRYLSSASFDKTAKVIDTETGEEVSILTFNSPVSQLQFSESNRYLAVASDDRSVQLLNLQTGKLLGEKIEHTSDISGILFSDDDRYLVTYGKDRVLQIVDTRTGGVVALVTYEGVIDDVVVSDDSKYIITRSSDKVAKLIDLMTGKEVMSVSHDKPLEFVGFSQDSETFISASTDAVIYLTKISGEQTDAAEACDRLGENLSVDNWNRYINLPIEQYSLTCENAPVDNSLIVEASRFVQSDKLKESRALFKRIVEVSPDTDLYPNTLEVENNADLAERLWQADSLIQDGIRASKSDKLDKAIENFTAAQAIVPSIDLNPDTVEQDSDAAQAAASVSAQSKADKHVISTYAEPTTDRLKSALEAYKEAQSIYSEVRIFPSQWNQICRAGTLNDIPAQVISACDVAVEKEPDHGGWHDSRGIARARMGDLTGAIEDFEFYIKWEGSSPTKEKQRKQWIEKLKEGENPFIYDVLQDLK